MFKDRYGLELTTGSAEAAELYVEGVDASLAGNVGTEEKLEAALAADPGFALAQVALGRSLQFVGKAPERAARWIARDAQLDR